MRRREGTRVYVYFNNVDIFTSSTESLQSVVTVQCNRITSPPHCVSLANKNTTERISCLSLAVVRLLQFFLSHLEQSDMCLEIVQVSSVFYLNNYNIQTLAGTWTVIIIKNPFNTFHLELSLMDGPSLFYITEPIMDKLKKLVGKTGGSTRPYLGSHLSCSVSQRESSSHVTGLKGPVLYIQEQKDESNQP